MLYLEKFNGEPTGRILTPGADVLSLVGYTYEPYVGITLEDSPVIYDGTIIKFDDHPEKESMIERSKKSLASFYDYVVNIVNEGGKNKAVLEKVTDETALNLERGDLGFYNLERAEKYVEIYNNEGEESAKKFLNHNE